MVSLCDTTSEESHARADVQVLKKLNESTNRGLATNALDLGDRVLPLPRDLHGPRGMVDASRVEGRYRNQAAEQHNDNK